MLDRARTLNDQPSRVLGISLPFTFGSVGLTGTRGVAYGPLPVWIYQLFLGMTHNPIVLIIMRALLSSAMTAIALIWLARVMRVSLWFAMLTMLSPWLWLFGRMLWDNSICIPLAALSMAAYGDSVATRRRWPLLIAALCMAAMTLVHFMSFALIGAVIVHAILFQSGLLRRIRWGLLAVLILWGVVSWPYLDAMRSSYSPVATSGSAWNGWWLPLLGGHHLTAGFDWMKSTRGQGPMIYLVCQAITLVAHLAVWAGMVLVVVRFWAFLARRQVFTPADHLALVSIGVAGCQSVMDGIERLDLQPHYFNATWIAYAVLAWYGAAAFYQRFGKLSVAWRVPPVVYAASMIVVLGISIFRIHRDGGTRNVDYGTDLKDQMQAIRKIQQFSPVSPLEMKYLQWKDFPAGENVLVNLLPPPAGPRPLRRLIVRYRDAFPGDARIAVEDVPYSQDLK